MTASDDKPGFLRRWSKQKREAEALVPVDLPPVEVQPVELPPLESLDATSDFTVFLQPGVSADMQRLALQRAWQSDATIAGFRGMAEYAWDFNAPDYGRLSAVDDAARLLAEVIAPPPSEPRPADPPSPTPPSQLAQAPEKPAPSTPDEPEPTRLRRHGSALPS